MASEVPTLVANLRANFNSDATRSYEWRVTQLNILKKMLNENREELSKALYDDLHRSRVETNLLELSSVMHEIEHTLENLKEWMEPVSKSTNLLNLPGTSSVHSDPLGVILVMAPWNYPLYLIFAPLVGVLAAGNVCILRPAAYSSACSKTMDKLIRKYFAPDVVAIVIGGRDITTAVLKERYDLIFFTGGITLGKIVMQAASNFLTPVVLELGGKSPCIVDKSADIDISSKRLTWGAFVNAGQTCVRPDYGLVHKDKAEELITLMKNNIKSYYTVGNDQSEFALHDGEGRTEGLEQSPFFGRIIDGGNAIERLAGIIDHDKKYIVSGGRYDLKKRFVEPTIMDFGTDVKAFLSSKCMSEEIFGPIFPILRVDSVEQSIEIIRKFEKPLSMYCFTTDSTTRKLITRNTTSGSLVFNDCLVQLTNQELPFGGVGQAGMGQYHGYYSFKCFSHEKAVLRKYNVLDVPARYPPYTTGKQALMSTLLTPVSSATKCILKYTAIAIAIGGTAFLSKQYILPACLPKLISLLEGLNSKL